MCMLKYLFCAALVAICMLSSCRKTLSVGDTSFEVLTSRTELTTNDTTTFSFTGNPDIISFYSGEPGKRYEYRNRISAEGTPILKFRSLRANGSQANSLQVMVSADFAGVAVADTPTTVSNIKAA